MAKRVEGMKIIYSPSGRAGEYANHGYAVNLYNGCVHGCRYCYVPACKRLTHEKFHASVTPQKDILKRLEHDVKLGVFQEPIFLSFSCDPYPPGEINKLTREAIKIIIDSGNRVNILTKGGSRAERDFDLLASVPGNKIGATLTFCTNNDSKAWEPEAALPYDRVAMLQIAHSLGIYAWVSMEPVIIPEQTLTLIYDVYQFADEIRVGKWNHSAEANKIDWKDFYYKAKSKLDHYGVKYILKDDLLIAAGVK
jgi:DNA repair photolyase